MSKTDNPCWQCRGFSILALITGLRAYERRTHQHHLSYSALVRTAGDGCGLCNLLLGSLFKEDQPLDESKRKDSATKLELLRRTTSDSSTASSGIIEDVVGWHEELDAGREKPPFLIEVTAESTLTSNFAVEYVVRYQRPFQPKSRHSSIVEGPKPRRLIVSNNIDLGFGINNRPIGSFPAFSLYSKWVQDCAHGPRHVHCRKAGLVDLPERLIDVGVGDAASQPKLAITRGMQGEYLTLSHCWGKHRVLTTTSKNIQEHIKGIAFGHFPKMFRDAMLVTRILGYRYLWIDSLCIVQDDVADWETECSRMGDIYLNSVCTLAAPSASSSEGTLLGERPPSDLKSVELEARNAEHFYGWVTLGPYPPEFKEKQPVLSSRAWVLQEQLLSPRTLYFGPKGMYFQCNSHEYLETHHHPLPPERITPWRTAEAGDLPKSLLSMTFKDPLYWYSIVRQYSFRNLTFGDDKLPALSGLASIISHQWNDDVDGPFGEYQSGLWSKDFCRGLLWMTDTAWLPSKTLHKIDELAPSWSWASQNTPVEWKLLQEFKPDVEVISCKMELSVAHKFGRVRSGVLELNGPTRSAFLQRRGGTKTIFLSGIADVREVAEISLDGTATAFLHATWPDRDSSFACRALMLGKADSSLYGSRWYGMLLVPIGQRRYRRIGICNSLGSEATHPRSFTVEQSYNWFGSASEETIVIV